MTLQMSRWAIVAAAVLLLPPGVQAQVSPGVAAAPAGSVTISRPEYDRLLDLASRQPPPAEAPPIAGALTRADIQARVGAGVVRATMQVDGEVFRTGPAKVPLIVGDTLIEARMAGGPLPLIVEGNAHVAVITGPSTFSAVLEWGAPLTTSPGRGSFVMPVPPAGSATAVIEVPGEQTDVRIAPGLVLRRTSANGLTTVEATLEPGSRTQVSWSTREMPQASPREARLLADVKTLVTIGEAEIRLVTLVDLTVVQGEPSAIEVTIPDGYEVSGVSGASLERHEERPGVIVLFVTTPSQRRHQFLLSLERSNSGGSFKLETAVPALPSAQRETGEIAVEGIGTLEISVPETPGLRRVDVREVDPALASAARQPLLAAFRYQRGPGAVPMLALGVTRFADAPVLAAVAERAIATTLVTSEGRALTEVSLWVRNRAQPFIKVALPAGASMLSVEVAGEPAKPVEGKDGTRVPLLRPGFRSDGPYAVSFVYLHAGSPFDKKGNMQMTLPKMDLPISVVEWELFVPDRYRVDRFAGNAFAANLVGPLDEESDVRDGRGTGGGLGGGTYRDELITASNGQIVGRVVDANGTPLPGATITASGSGRTQSAISDQRGVFVISGVPSGPVTVTGQLNGFSSARRSFVFDQRPRQADLMLQIGGVQETVTVMAEAPFINTRSSESGQTIQMNEPKTTQSDNAQRTDVPSANVQSLQRRAAGVLPIRIEVPRAGTSHRFVKPLVIDEETVVSFRYMRR
jgi:carboxypeptidase family protein